MLVPLATIELARRCRRSAMFAVACPLGWWKSAATFASPLSRQTGCTSASVQLVQPTRTKSPHAFMFALFPPSHGRLPYSQLTTKRRPFRNSARVRNAGICRTRTLSFKTFISNTSTTRIIKTNQYRIKHRPNDNNVCEPFSFFGRECPGKLTNDDDDDDHDVSPTASSSFVKRAIHVVYICREFITFQRI